MKLRIALATIAACAALSSAALADSFTASPDLGPQKNLGKVNPLPDRYITGDYMVPSVVSNSISHGNTGISGRSVSGRAAVEIPNRILPIYVGAEARQYNYQTTTHGTTGTDFDTDVRLGIKVTGPRVYAAISEVRYGSGGNLAGGFPREHGLGYGVEKLPDLEQNFSVNGSLFYYPNLIGTSSIATVSHRGMRYRVGATLKPTHSPAFIDVGYLGDNGGVRGITGTKYRRRGVYTGLGLHF